MGLCVINEIFGEAGIWIEMLENVYRYFRAQILECPTIGQYWEQFWCTSIV